MGLLSVILGLLRELAPFLKEALFEGQSFRVWFKANTLTFAWLLNTLILMLTTTYLSDELRASRYRELQVSAKLEAMAEPMQRFTDRYKDLRERYLTGELARRELSKHLGETETKLQDAQTKLSESQSENARLRRRLAHRPKVTKPPTKSEPPPEKPKKHTGFFQRIKNLLGGHDNDKEERQ